MTYRYRHIFLLLTLLLCLSAAMAESFTPAHEAMQVSARAQAVPAQITLNWPDDEGYGAGYAIWRKAVTETQWGKPLAEVPRTAQQYVDTTARVGVVYDYRVGKLVPPHFYSYGYVRSGIEAPVIDHRGTVVLVVDTVTAAAMPEELAQWKRDLLGDGWGVIRHDVAPTDAPAAIRRLLQNDYFANPAEVRAVLLFGRVPIIKSGSLSPDGHAARPFPCDPYYADLDGAWTDTMRIVDPLTGNSDLTPNDGILDPGIMPSPLELECGRVYLGNLPAFAPKDETALLRQYLVKEHRFRTAELVPERRTLIDDVWWQSGHQYFMMDIWRDAAPLVGQEQVFERKWGAELPAHSYLLAFAGGPGYYDSVGGVTTTRDLVTADPKVAFTGLYGSYFCEWDHPDNVLRGMLATTTMGLTAQWATCPFRRLFPMGLGDTIGAATRLAQNDDGTLFGDINVCQIIRPLIATALMGDPTLRLHSVPPPGPLTATPHPGSVALSWTPTTATDCAGYLVSRAPGANGPFTRLTAIPVSSPTFLDRAPLPGENVYQVRAVKLEQTGSGSYFNTSLGVFATAATPSPAAQPDLQLKNAADADYTGEHLYLDDARQTKGQVAEPDAVTVYHLRVCNDGARKDTLAVTAPPAGSGWRVRYFDALTGGQEITNTITAGGWRLLGVEHGEGAAFRVEVTRTGAGKPLALPITVTSALDAKKKDRVVLQPILPPDVQPDLSVQVGQEKVITGAGIYGLTGENQQVTRPVPLGQSLSYLITLRNPSAQRATFSLQNEYYDFRANDWTFTFTDAATGRDVVNEVGEGWLLTLDPGASRTIRFTLNALPKAKVGDTLTFKFHAIALGVVPRFDVVIVTGTIVPAVATAPVCQPDLMLSHLPRNGENDFFNGTRGIVNNDERQTFEDAMLKEGKRNYYLCVANTNPVDADTITVRLADTHGWVVTGYDAGKGGTDITGQLTGKDGWTLTKLAPNGHQDFRLVITPAADTPLDQPVNFVITSVSQTDPTKSDRVIIHSVCTRQVQTDLLLRNADEQAFSGEHIREPMPNTQKKAQTVAPGQTAVYYLRERNDSPYTAAFKLSPFGTTMPDGWTLRIFDAVDGGRDITAEVMGNIWETSRKLAPGEYCDFRIEITPSRSVSSNAVASMIWFAQSVHVPMTGSDTCQLVTTRELDPRYYPDLQIRPTGQEGYLGVHVHNRLDAQTTGSSVRRGGSVAYGLCVQNDGAWSDVITLTAPATQHGWSYRYFDAPVGGTEITDKITGAGWTLPEMAPGAAREFRVVVTPGTGASDELRVTAASTREPVRHDVVAARTVLLNGAQPDLAIRTGVEATFHGAGIYRTLPEQTARGSVAAGATAVYLLQLSNTGDDSSPLRITGNGGSAGWIVRYFNAPTGGTDITAQVTGAGYPTGPFAAKTDLAVLRVEVTPAGTAGTPCTLRITAAAVSDPAHTDSVQAVTTRGRGK